MALDVIHARMGIPEVLATQYFCDIHLQKEELYYMRTDHSLSLS